MITPRQAKENADNANSYGDYLSKIDAKNHLSYYLRIIEECSKKGKYSTEIGIKENEYKHVCDLLTDRGFRIKEIYKNTIEISW